MLFQTGVKINKPYSKDICVDIFGGKAVFLMSRDATPCVITKDPLLCVPRSLGVCFCQDASFFIRVAYKKNIKLSIVMDNLIFIRCQELKKYWAFGS